MTTLKKIFNNKLVIAAITILVLYTVVGFWLVPYLVGRIGPNQVAEKMQRELRLGMVKLNPFLFQFQADDVGLYEQDGALIAGFNQVYIDFELISLFRWALVFKTVRLDRPQINIVIDPDGFLNLARLQPETAPDHGSGPSAASPAEDTASSEQNAEPSTAPAEKDAAPLRMIFEHIQIVAGEIDFMDQRQSIPAKVAIRPLNIELKDISTLPDREGPYSLVATTQDQESFHWTGGISLHPFSSAGRLGFSDIKMATLWQFFRDAVTLAEPKGRISIESDYKIDLGQSEPSVYLSNLALNLAELSLTLSGDETPLLELTDFNIDAPRVDIIQQIIDVESIQFAGVETSVIINETGDLNWNRISAAPQASDSQPITAESTPQAVAAETAPKSSSPKFPPVDEPERSWQVHVAEVALGDVHFQFKDTSRSPQLFADVADLACSFKFGLQAGSSGTALQVNNGSLALNDITLRNPESPEPEIGIKTIQVTGAAFDFAPQALLIKHVSIQDGNIQLIRETGGKLNLVSLFVPPESQAKNQAADRPDTQPERQPQGETGQADVNETAAFNYAVQSAELAGFKIAFSDKTVKADGTILQVDNLRLTAENIDGASQMPVGLSFDLQAGGRVELAGRIDPIKPAVQADIDIQALSLSPFASYIKPHADLRLTSGTISTRGEFGYQAEAGPATVSYTGGVDVSALRILPSDSDETLLGWNQFVTQDLQFQLEPDLLEISDLKLSGLDGQFIIFEDGSVNFTQIFKQDPGAAPASVDASGKDPGTTTPDPTKESGKAETDSKSAENEAFPIAIHKLRFENGGLFFADYSLVPQFATRIHQLAGSIIGVSSQPGARAQVQLNGRVNDYGLSKIEGEINFFDPGAYTDMAVLFQNLEMTRLTPYSGKFVGRRIDSGKLTLDLKYDIEDRKLKGDNQVIVEQIALGEAVESPDAVPLPLNLAIAILEDADGVIDLGLPVSGDLDDPKFSYGHLIWKAFVNIITKLATAPFRALGALLGGDAETLDAIEFEAGSAEILPPEAEKLVKLAGALQQRPNLKLIVQGRFSHEADGQALKDMNVRQAVVSRQGTVLAPDEDPGLLDFGNPVIQTALEQVYSDHFGPEKLAQRKQQTNTDPVVPTDQDADSHEPTDIQDPAAMWKELFQSLVAESQIADSRLVQLAEVRASAVLSELQGTVGLPQHRVTLKPAKVLKPGKTPRVKLMLEPMKVKGMKKTESQPE